MNSEPLPESIPATGRSAAPGAAAAARPTRPASAAEEWARLVLRASEAPLEEARRLGAHGRPEHVEPAGTMSRPRRRRARCPRPGTGAPGALACPRRDRRPGRTSPGGGCTNPAAFVGAGGPGAGDAVVAAPPRPARTADIRPADPHGHPGAEAPPGAEPVTEPRSLCDRERTSTRPRAESRGRSRPIPCEEPRLHPGHHDGTGTKRVPSLP